MRKVGSRIGAIRNADGDTVYLFGYGRYVGDEVPPANTGGLAPLCHDVGRANPKLVLDDGTVVWGAECWWGGEEAVRKRVAGYAKVVMVKPERKEADGE